MICKHCHKKNNYNHKYCFYCGELLNDEVDIVEDDTIDNENQTGDLTSDFKEEQNPNIEETENNSSDHYDDTNDIEKVENDDEINPNAIDNPDATFETADSGLNTLLFNIDDPEEPIKTNKKIIPYVIGLILVSCLVIVFIIIKPFSNQANKNVNASSEEVTLTYTIESTQIKEGTDAQKITFYISSGESISLLGKSTSIENGQAQFLITNGVIEQMGTVIDGKLALQATIYNHDGTKKEENVLFPSLTAPATFTLLKPSNLSFETTDDSFNFEAQLTPDSSILINNENYSDQIDDNGILSITLPIDITQIETSYKLTISEPNKTDINETLFVTYTSEVETLNFDSDISVPLLIDSSEKHITITGKASSKTKITSSTLDPEDISINTSGEFSITFNPEHVGYNLYPLSFSSSDSSTIEKIIIVDYTPSLTEYVQSAWAPDPYDYLKKIEDAHNGEHFLLTGQITKIISKENNKTSFLLELDTNNDELYYIDYWGDFNYKVNDSIKVFGNKWGLKEDYPFILCKEIALKK